MCCRIDNFEGVDASVQTKLLASYGCILCACMHSLLETKTAIQIGACRLKLYNAMCYRIESDTVTQ